MKKKFIVVLLILGLGLTALACEKKNELADQALDQGRLHWSSGEYEKALNSFKLALDEGYDGEDLVEIEGKIDILEAYKKGRGLFLEGKLEEARVIFMEVLDGENPGDLELEVRELLKKLEEKLELAQVEEEVEREEKKEEKKEDKKLDEPVVKDTGKVDEYMEKYSVLINKTGVDQELTSSYMENNDLDYVKKVLKDWDDLLNEAYQVLKKQLSKEEMDALVLEQREWIKTRDRLAEKACSDNATCDVYKTDYIESWTLASLTSERTYVLIREYMR